VSSHDESTRTWERWAGAGSTDEHRRLMLMERAYDPFTIAHLERTGVAEGWRCLEVGAGAGSIAGWLGRRAGPTNVTATELFPDYLAEVADLGVRVVRHDVTADPPLATEFDLIHARLLLEHLQAREQVVERLASWLAPGGWLVLESATFVPAMASLPALRRVGEAWVAMIARTVGSDLTWARTFPLPLERAGLAETSAEVSMPVIRGGSPGAATLEASVRPAAPALLAAGAVTAEDLDEAYAFWADRAQVDYSFLMIVAWGRRPVST
jgi:SAM-dependent methyltransferase